MKTRMLIIGIFSLVALQASAQDSYIKNRWNIKLAYQTRISKNELYSINKPLYNITLNYGVFNHFECGLNIAYSVGISTDKLKYYANCNFHILPFFVDAEDFRFDFYVTANCGGITYFYGPTNVYQPNGTFEYRESFKLHKLYYGGGAGAAFYPFKHVGIYSEFTYEEYFLTKAWFLKYGLSVKF